MMADWAKLPYEVLAKASLSIADELPGISRVVYDITSRAPTTFLFCYIRMRRLRRWPLMVFQGQKSKQP